MQLAPYSAVSHCRSCGSAALQPIHNFGVTPIADRLVRPGAEDDDRGAPLSLVQCATCSLAQISQTVAPDYLFHADYPYYSSVSNALLSHFHTSADRLIERLDLDETSLVVEAASNDGYMLRRFHESGIPVLGVDPAAGPVAAARRLGVETLHDFFTYETARTLKFKGVSADLFLANNVLAHVEDVNDFVQGISAILSDSGTAVLEFPYLIDLVDHCAFDTIYHQHLLYLTLGSVRPIFERNGLFLNDVERHTIHGGSLRVFVSKTPGTTPALEAALMLEDDRKAHNPTIFEPMLNRMQKMRDAMKALIHDYRAKGVQIAGYGAAAKATTLLHHLGIGQRDLAFIVDKNPKKHGLLMPGTHIPIHPPSALYERQPNAAVILAWNFANEIMAENESFVTGGGEFIVPIPDVVVTKGQQMSAAL